MGFKNAQGQEVAFTVPDLPPATPTADARRAGGRRRRSRRASSTAAATSTSRTSPCRPGRQLDDASITDLAPEFTIAVTSGPGTVALDSTQAPILIDASNDTYRYWVTRTGHGLDDDDRADAGRRQTTDSTWALVDTTSGNTSPNPTDRVGGVHERRHGRPAHGVHRRRARTDRRTRRSTPRRSAPATSSSPLDGSTTGPLPITIIGSPTQIPGTERLPLLPQRARSPTARSTSRSRPAPGRTPRC